MGFKSARHGFMWASDLSAAIPYFLLSKMSRTITPIYEAPFILKGQKERLRVPGPWGSAHTSKELPFSPLR